MFAAVDLAHVFATDAMLSIIVMHRAAVIKKLEEITVRLNMFDNGEER